MPLEKQVCSLELAKKLKELGVKQESLFCWYESGDGKIFVATRAVTTGLCSAFTVAEFGTYFGNVHPDVLQMAYNHVFHVEGSRFITPTGLQLLLQDPDLCAAMLVYLIENKLITI